jgi:hypothetical protein
MWPEAWDHRLLKSQLHIAAGHLIRFTNRHWWIECPAWDKYAQDCALRCLTLRDVVDDLAAHLVHCDYREILRADVHSLD